MTATAVEEWKTQASFKFGHHQQGLLNVRAASLEELDCECRKIPDVAGTLVVAAEVLSAESVVRGSFPGTTTVGAQGNVAGAGGVPAPTCPHGPRQYNAAKDGTWKGWFCSLPKDSPAKCKPEWVK